LATEDDVTDIVDPINATTREITEEVGPGEARTVTIGRSYDAPIDDVWDACTNAARIPRWFLPITGDLRVGGRYQLEGNAGGTIERCDPPNSFAATWEFGGTVTWIEVRLRAESATRTRLELDHTANISEQWTEYGPGAVGIGWDVTVRGLGLHLVTGETLDPNDGAAWLASREGVEFMTRSSRAWCDADIASGTERADAEARAERTTAAYLGTSE
jgi:uncharacterized protein YndB with AHSA1/START domain